MKKVAIIMGSASDLPVVEKAINTLATKLKKFKTEGYLQKDSFNQIDFIEKVKEILTKYHIQLLENHLRTLHGPQIQKLVLMMSPKKTPLGHLQFGLQLYI